MAGYKIYKQHNLYYLTLTIVGWVDVFTRPIYRDIIINSLTFCQKEKGLVVHAYVVMSNHVHLRIRQVIVNERLEFLRIGLLIA